jgi:DNA repair protein RadC
MNYAIPHATLLTYENEEYQYNLKIKDLPLNDRPLEKLQNQGVSSLSLAELFAVVLHTGTKKEGVMEMSKRIIREYGTSAVSNQTSPKDVSTNLDIPIQKACQIIACVEIGKRLFKKNEMGLAVIRNARDAYEHLVDMKNLSKEQLCGLYLDTHNRVIHQEVISIGTINTNIVHPREVFKPALEYGAVAVVLAHNHPSGVPEPSAADIEVTKQLVEAGRIIGIHLMDHLVIGKEGYSSVHVEY